MATEQEQTAEAWYQGATSLTWDRCYEVAIRLRSDAPGGAVLVANALGNTQEEAERRAQMIAAAHDLLRVAELLVDWLDEEEGAHALCDTARAAIAKATA